MCMWQSAAFDGALSFGDSVPDELGTDIWAPASRDRTVRPALNAASPALARNFRLGITPSLITVPPLHTARE